MSNTSWKISGDYFETCNCDYLCPCLSTNLAGDPTHGHCNVALAYHIETGHYGDVTLDDLCFVVVAHTPGAMGAGNWRMGLIADERSTPEQQEALVSIASGQAGGPIAALAPLVGEFVGVELQPITYRQEGNTRSLTIPGLVEQGVEGVPSVIAEGEPLYFDNTLHPSNRRLALGKATNSSIHAFGIDWDDASGNNNGHFAPFNWQNG